MSDYRIFCPSSFKRFRNKVTSTSCTSGFSERTAKAPANPAASPVTKQAGITRKLPKAYSSVDIQRPATKTFFDTESREIPLWNNEDNVFSYSFYGRRYNSNSVLFHHQKISVPANHLL